MHASVNSVLASLSENEWLLDSACSYHMTPRREVFSDYVQMKNCGVTLADGTMIVVNGIGTVCLKFVSGSVLTLKNVRHVPTLSHNLISCAVLEDDGFRGDWGDGCMNIMKGSRYLFKALRMGNMYVCSAESSASMNVVQNDLSELWHKGLGHMSNKWLSILHKNQYFGNDKVSSVTLCDSCILGKQTHVLFPEYPSPNLSRCTEILEYIHADVWGPTSVPTYGGNRYFLSIIDDYSRKVFVFLLKQKSDVFDKFKTWKTLIENQTGKRIKTLRTDNGIEFCNLEFDNLCANSGIRRHKSVVHTPQQNGVAERMNRTLLERVRSMLTSSGLPKLFWGEAILTATYLINRSPSMPLNGDLPESVWCGKKVDLSNLHVFGYAAFVHHKGDKLEPRFVKCIFLGYPDGVKGYRLWLKGDFGYKIIISRDVIFNESGFPCLAVPNVVIPQSTPNEVEQLPIKSDDVSDSELSENLQDQTVELPNVDDLSDYQLARDRPRREHVRKPKHFDDFHLASHVFNVFESLDGNEPKSYKDALKSDKSTEWLNSMNDEMNSLHVNQTWELVPKPVNCSVVDCNWLFKVKNEVDSIKYKARLVAKGFTQK
ncbi:PREDICTED: retrovirus-related Pol polyprotein from transposon TNT 1-94 [Erythranthe guttata]|uniref:retrovirus-related Pol polyprotein from transposon TNT 1-94 n=1 Tax=Erythranthe guttata TaxID=4155 RepID=UPI00064DBE39|nr:PREDICTED: retrovirus-related Pol polyprotein from transposon TNT 1-94 [Erythranthe guttata]|eukprot:XP_012849888.1 PREDICTED: retrovirus-related Pol polyprotein from transposon TNT 1-94 [Erythranthe guttata]